MTSDTILHAEYCNSTGTKAKWKERYIWVIVSGSNFTVNRAIQADNNDEDKRGTKEG